MIKLKSLLKESKLLVEFDKKTNIVDVDATDIVDQMEQEDGTGTTEIGKAMKTATGWGKKAMAYSTGDKSPKAMVADVGRKKLIARIEKVQGMVSSASPGLSKPEMPALEGSDGENVKDALSDTEGEIAVDLDSKWGAGDGSGDFDKWWDSLDDEKKKLFDKPGFDDIDVVAQAFGQEAPTTEAKIFKNHRMMKLANLLTEAPPVPDTGGSPMDGAPLVGEKAETSLAALKGKAKAFLMKGMLDGGAKDSIKIDLSQPYANNAMKPTQSNILIGKSMLFALQQWNKNPDSNVTDMGGAFVTSGNEILDGHHRWSGAYIATGGSLSHTNVHIVTGKAADLIPILAVIGNALGRENKGKPDPKEED